MYDFKYISVVDMIFKIDNRTWDITIAQQLAKLGHILLKIFQSPFKFNGNFALILIPMKQSLQKFDDGL